jgi:hypothetical protein
VLHASQPFLPPPLPPPPKLHPFAAARNPHAAHILAQAAQQAAKREARLAAKAQQPKGAKLAKGKKVKRKKAEEEVRGAGGGGRGARGRSGAALVCHAGGMRSAEAAGADLVGCCPRLLLPNHTWKSVAD